ncbi:MAG: hypothetical protein K2H50_05735 [Paramuribaculum sp.]|nr:hypothetical protein [Paramuribaculum sp.]
MIKISKMEVLKIKVLFTASPLRGSMRVGWHRAPTCAKCLVTHRLAPAELTLRLKPTDEHRRCDSVNNPEQAIAQLRDRTV